MAAVMRQANLDARIVGEAAAWYQDNLHHIPEPFRQLEPAVLRRAVGLCRGDWRRCITDGDGTVIVCKHPVW